jgi:hypothetical protein
MTAVATIQPNNPVQWDQELRGAQYLLKSGLVPADIRTPEAAMFIILTGRDLGMSPVQSLRSIRVIKGKVEVAADAQLGKFHSAGGRSRFIELTNTTARLELTAAWLTAPHVETFTAEDAKVAGLTGDNWRKFPKAMLRSRAITAGLKSIGFDATAGIYSPGEVGGEAVVIGDQVVSAEVVEVEVEVVHDGEAVPTLPGAPEKWGGNGGKPIAECGESVLKAFLKWAQGDADRAEKLAPEIAAALQAQARLALEATPAALVDSEDDLELDAMLSGAK